MYSRMVLRGVGGTESSSLDVDVDAKNENGRTSKPECRFFIIIVIRTMCYCEMSTPHRLLLEFFRRCERTQAIISSWSTETTPRAHHLSQKNLYGQM